MNCQSHIVKIESVLRLWCMRNFQKYKTNIKTNFCENFKFQQCLEPSIRSLKNVPNIYKEMTTNWAKNWSCSLYLPSALFPSCYGLTQALTVRVLLSLALRVTTSILFVRFLTTMARQWQDHELMLNQKFNEFLYF